MAQHNAKTCRLCSLQRHPARAQEAAQVRRILPRQASTSRRSQGGKA